MSSPTPADQLEQYRLLSTSLFLTSVTAFHPDDGPPEAPSIDFVIRLELGHLLLVSDGHNLSISLAMGVYASLLEHGRMAIEAGSGFSGADTAIGRSITALQLDLVKEDEPRPAPLHRAVYNLNHCAPSSNGPLAWRRLLEGIVAVIDPSLPLRPKLDWLLTWFAQAE